jgi:hypothetical protein
MVAVDFDNGRIWFGVNNTWFIGTSPGGTSADFTFAPGQALWPVVFVFQYSGGALAATFNPGSSAFQYALPSGFTAWG